MNYRKFKYQIILVPLSVLLTVLCLSLTLKKNPPAGKVIFFDDFSGKQLDRSKWNVEITGMHVNNELQAYVDSAQNIFIAHGKEAEGATNGALVLMPTSSPGFVTKDGQKFDFTSGRINTKSKFEFTYGTAEARIKLTDGAGLWPAWWMLGNGAWPQCGEVDIMEYVGEKDWISSAVHGPGYSGETPFVNRLYLPAANDITRWHIYAVEWTSDCLNFKVDGNLMFRVNKKMAEHYGKWSFDNAKFLILNYALGGAYPVKINGVKTPYNGLPEATVQQIKNHQAKMLVDWVRVTKMD